MQGPTKKLGPIGSAVLTFIGYKQTDADKQSIYIDVHEITKYVHEITKYVHEITKVVHEITKYVHEITK